MSDQPEYTMPRVPTVSVGPGPLQRVPKESSFTIIGKTEDEIWEDGREQGIKEGIAMCTMYLRGVQDALEQSEDHSCDAIRIATDAMLKAVHTI